MNPDNSRRHDHPVCVFSTMGGGQYHVGIHEYCEGYLEYRWGCSVGDIIINVGDIINTMEGDIMSTVGVFSAVGGYHLLLFEYLRGL